MFIFEFFSFCFLYAHEMVQYNKHDRLINNCLNHSRN